MEAGTVYEDVMWCLKCSAAESTPGLVAVRKAIRE